MSNDGNEAEDFNMDPECESQLEAAIPRYNPGDYDLSLDDWNQQPYDLDDQSEDQILQPNGE